MCGIVGFTGKKNQQLLDKLLSTIKHRGRDETSCYYSPNVNLGMNRFSIIDLSNNLYPMKYRNYVLIFNGEIYNYKELKNKLIKKGVKFSTKSDAEVILPLYHFYKEKAFKMLEGMFAICIYDTKTKTLMLTRDKSGEKPLYYSNYKKTPFFIFASELKTIQCFLDIKTLNPKALLQYLHHGSVYTNSTLIKDVKKIRPSKYLIYDIKNNSIDIKSYWSPKKKVIKSIPSRTLSDTLSKLLQRSVEIRLIADVPVGAFLSGGLDSSLIAYFASQKIDKLNTYSVSFPGFVKNDESKFSKIISNKIAANHTEILCTPKNVKEVVEKIGYYIDEPIVDPAFIPTYLLAKEARKKVKVVLTGEGADELFGGYYRYHKELFAENLKNLINFEGLIKLMREEALPNRLNKLLTPLLLHYSPQTVWTENELKKLLNVKQLTKRNYIKRQYKNTLWTMQFADYRGYLAEQLLMKNDKATMIHNLEARAPYLDTKIIEFAFSLPNKYKVRGIHGKYILKKVAEKYLPKYVVWRPKHGFSLPLNYWFRHSLKSLATDSMSDLKDYEKLINLKYLDKMIKDHLSKNGDYGNKIFSMIVLGKWLKHNKVSL